MKLNFFLVIVITVFISENIFAQDKVSVIMNNKMVGETVIPENPLILSVSKAKYKNLSKLVLKYTSQNAESPYKRSIEVTDAAENSFYIINESKGGLYNINLTSVKNKILAQKVIKIFLIMNPANDRMSMPSTRKLIIELHLK